MHIIGIDPGATTGLSLMSTETNEIKLHSVKWSLWDIVSFIATGWGFGLHSVGRLCFGVEIPRKILYGRNRPGDVKITLDAGINIGRAETLADWLEKSGHTVYRIAPIREKKWKADYVKLFYGIKRSNEHTRDALRIAEKARTQYMRERMAL